MSVFDELIWKSQQADLKREEERVLAERKATEALNATRRAPGTMGTNALLEKLYGTGQEKATTATPNAPKSEPSKEKSHGKFPPPPTRK